MVEFSNLGIIENQSIIKLKVDDVKTVTDNLPNSGTLTSLAQVINQSVIVANQSTMLDLVGSDATLANQSTILQYNQTIDVVADGIKGVTDILPDSGALTSIAQLVNQSISIANQSTILQNNATVDAVVDGIKSVTDLLPDAGALSSVGTKSNQSTILQYNATIDKVVDDIQIVTDAIPDAGAMTSIGSIANQSLMLTDGDNLISNTSSLIQTNATIDNVVDTILSNTSTLLSNTTEVSGFYNLSTSGGPHTVFTINITERKCLNSLFLDLINLSDSNNIKIDHKIDGTNYRTFVNMTWATTDDDGMYFNKNLAFSHDVRLTMSNGTSANATVPYSYILESME